MARATTRQTENGNVPGPDRTRRVRRRGGYDGQHSRAGSGDRCIDGRQPEPEPGCAPAPAGLPVRVRRARRGLGLYAGAVAAVHVQGHHAARPGLHQRRRRHLPGLVRRPRGGHLPAGRRDLAVSARRRAGDPLARAAALPRLRLGVLRAGVRRRRADLRAAAARVLGVRATAVPALWVGSREWRCWDRPRTHATT